MIPSNELITKAQKANNDGADQTAQVCRLFCEFVVRKTQKTGFLTSRPK